MHDADGSVGTELEEAPTSDNKEGGTGTRAKGEEGSMGRMLSKLSGAAKRDEAPEAQAAAAPAPAPVEVAPAAPGAGPAGTATAAASAATSPPPPSAGEAVNEPAQPARDAAEFGMIGVLDGADKAAAQSKPKAAPSAPWGKDSSLDNDALAARGNKWGDAIGDSFGAGGLGLSGTGKGGGGGGGLVGLSGIGALGNATSASAAKASGFGAGHGRLGGAHAGAAPKIRNGTASVSGGLPPEVVQRIVRQNFGRFRLCYENGLRTNPNLQGDLEVRFAITPAGEASNVHHAKSELADANVVMCVVAAFNGLSFPQPEGGVVVNVLYPLTFEPGAVAPIAPSPNQRINVNVFIGELPRRLLGCSAAASAPFDERVGLWRERLSKVPGMPGAAAQIYRSALGACEAPSYRERARLLSLMLDAMPGVTGKVSLYRAMASDLGAADVLYRGILARIRTPEEMRELHDALGLSAVDPGILAKLIQSTPDPGERAKKLRALLDQFPDDLVLSLELLNAYEDANDSAAARDHARKLRQRPDADARVRTAVGELYLRLAEHAATAEDKQSLLAEGRRAFGEIVEFAPEDPVARRRLGDLLLAHAFYADAARQYETLARLTPDDAKVLLLLASAAEGQGLLEEALKWAEKGGASGSPDGSSGPAVTARALASTHLAWARLAAADGKHTEELEALSARAARLLSGNHIDPDKPAGVRVSLTWSHPELHPSLWTNALGTAMPAPDGDITLGVAQAVVPERGDSFIEVRLEPGDVAHAARLGATAELTVVFDELGKTEKIVRRRIKFERGGPPTQRFSLASKEVRGG
jgi:Ca-activated chloride channel family protein